jgi:hypothetical protein
MECQIEKDESEQVEKLAARILRYRALNVKELVVSKDDLRYILRALMMVRCIECN